MPEDTTTVLVGDERLTVRYVEMRGGVLVRGASREDGAEVPLTEEARTSLEQLVARLLPPREDTHGRPRPARGAVNSRRKPVYYIGGGRHR